MNKRICHNPGCSRIVDYSGDYCRGCDNPRSEVEKLQDKYVQGEIDELELESKLECILQ